MDWLSVLRSDSYFSRHRVFCSLIKGVFNENKSIIFLRCGSELFASSGFCMENQQEVTYEEFFNELIVKNTIDENASESRQMDDVFLNSFGQNLLCYIWIDAGSPEAKLGSMDLIDIFWCMG